MTREEIKQEAEEQVNVCTPYHTGSFIQGYIAAVESWQAKSEKTEKQLRKEIEEFKETNHELAELAIERQKEIDELEKCRQTLSDCTDRQRKENAELKKENEQLKQQIEKMKLCQNCKSEDNDYMEKPCCDCSRCLGDIKRKGTTDKWELKENGN